MDFDPFATILLMYCLLVCGTMSVLYWAFKDGFNLSGQLFIFSEILRVPCALTVALFHARPDFRTGLTYYIANGFFMIAEVTFIYSLYALSNNNVTKYYIKSIITVLMLSILLEIIRLNNSFIALQLYTIFYAFLSFAAVWICAYTRDDELRKSPFWKILKYIETIFFAINVLRIVIQFTGTVASPMQSDFHSLVLLSIILALLLFRYISYQSVWMTWTSPHAAENKLNKTLLTTLRDRDIFLQQLAISNRRIGVSVLASSLAHQLSQPLTGVALQAEVVKQKLIRNPNDSEALNGIEKVTHILSHLSDVVRNLRSLFSAKDERLEEIDLSTLCDDAINLSHLSQKASAFTFRKQGSVRSRVFGNGVQIQQVIINIIDNAIEASHAYDARDRIIDFTLSEETGKVSLTIRDHGPGFSPEMIDHLFDMYRTAKENGSGLGLWLCRQIVEKHKGTITAFNHPEGGACIQMEFPIIGRSI